MAFIKFYLKQLFEMAVILLFFYLMNVKLFLQLGNMYVQHVLEYF